MAPMGNTACCGTLDSSTFGGTLQPFKVGSCCTSDMDNPNMKNERYKSPSTLKEGPNCANWAGVVASLPAQGSKSTQLPATNVCWRSWSCENSAASNSGRSANQGSLKRMSAAGWSPRAYARCSPRLKASVSPQVLEMPSYRFRSLQTFQNAGPRF